MAARSSTYHGLCTHNALFENILGYLELSREELEIVATVRKERVGTSASADCYEKPRKGHKSKPVRVKSSRQYDSDRSDDCHWRAGKASATIAEDYEAARGKKKKESSLVSG